jgi:Zn-dependent protease
MDFAMASQVMNMMLALIIALTFHEASHALVARLQGDQTAQLDGRLTLNPIPHLDPVGSIIFPLIGGVLSAMGGGFGFLGWAKPTPVNPSNFKNPKWGHVLTALAGPLSNLLLCTISVALYSITPTVEGSVWVAFSRLFYASIWINAILAVFNMIPLYPLDGGTVFSAFLPPKLKEQYDAIVIPYGFPLMILFIILGWRFISGFAQWWIAISQSIVANLIFF